MKYSAILLIGAAVAICSGCRHEYEPAPPPYYCQPAGCGCAPVPACNPCANPCAPTAAPYSAPTASSIQPRVAPGYTTVTPPPGTYTQPGGFAAPVNRNGSVGSP